MMCAAHCPVQVSDFGASRAKAKSDDVTMTAVGTPLFAAPEVMRGEVYDEKADVYSFGMLLLELAVPVPLLKFIAERWCLSFGKDRAPPQAMRLVNPMVFDGWRPATVAHPVPHCPPSVTALLAACVAHDPKDRPAFAEVLARLAGPCEAEAESGAFRRVCAPPPPRVEPRGGPRAEAEAVAGAGRREARGEAGAKAERRASRGPPPPPESGTGRGGDKGEGGAAGAGGGEAETHHSNPMLLHAPTPFTTRAGAYDDGHGGSAAPARGSVAGILLTEHLRAPPTEGADV